MTESAPIPGTGPEATPEELQESHEQFLASFADTLQGAEQLAESRGELPDEINAIFQDLADRVQARRVVISEGKSYGGGVETPDVVETQYFITLHNQDDTDATLPMKADDARALLAFAQKHKPAEAAPAEPQTGEIGAQADDLLERLEGVDPTEDLELSAEDVLEYVTKQFSLWSPPTLEDIEEVKQLVDSIPKGADGIYRDVEGNEIPEDLMEDARTVAAPEVWLLTDLEIRLTEYALELFKEPKDLSDIAKEDYENWMEYQFEVLHNPTPTLKGYRDYLQARLDLHAAVAAKHPELLEPEETESTKKARRPFRKSKSSTAPSQDVHPIEEPGEVAVPESEEYDEPDAEPAPEVSRQKARKRIGRFLGDAIMNARVELEIRRILAEEARAAQAAHPHSPTRPAGPHKPTHR